jgi:sugar lactone lactonase YvrE
MFISLSTFMLLMLLTALPAAVCAGCSSGSIVESYALVVDSSNKKLRKISISTNLVSTVFESANVDEYYDVAIASDGRFALVSLSVEGRRTVQYLNLSSNSYEYPTFHLDPNKEKEAQFAGPSGLAIATDQSFALVADSAGKIRRIDLQTYHVNPSIAGLLTGNSAYMDGSGSAARFDYPIDVALSIDSHYALVVDKRNHRIRKVDLTTADYTVSTVAGGDMGFQDGTAARFAFPSAIAIGPDGSFALVADSGNHRLRSIDLTTRVVSTIAGGTQGFADGAAARFSFPNGVSIQADASYALVADSGNSAIRQVSLSRDGAPVLGLTATIAGGPGPGYVDGPLTEARFNRPDRVQLSLGRVCSPCPAGAFSPGVDTTVCMACTPGKYSSAVGAASAGECRACAAGTYSEVDGLPGPRECRPCGPGRFSRGGASACADCGPGTASSSATAEGCAPCAAGSFSSAGGTACSPCAAGTYSTAVSTTSCSACPAGAFSTAVGAADAGSCQLCVAGLRTQLRHPVLDLVPLLCCQRHGSE